MRPKKYGGIRALRNSKTRKHLFWNQDKALSLDEILEFTAGRCTGKWWEVRRVSVSEDGLSLVRETVLVTQFYAIAWDLVKDPNYRR